MSQRNRSAAVRKIERRVRSKYIKRCVICFIIALILGLLGGIYLTTWGPMKAMTDRFHNAAPSETPAPAPTVEVPAEVTPDPKPAVTPKTISTPEPTAEPEATKAAEAEASSTEKPVAAAVTPEATAEATPAPEATPEPTVEAKAEATKAPEAEETAKPEAPVATEQPEGEPEAEATEAPAETPVEPAEGTDTQEPAGTPEAEGEGTPEAEATSAEPEQVPPPAEEKPLGTAENPVPLGESYSFETEIVSTGAPRYTASMEKFDTLQMTVAVKNYLTPDYFQKNYSTKFKLQGNEAGAGLDISLGEGAKVEGVNPQETVLICFEAEDGTIIQGFQLMDAEMGGHYGVLLNAGSTQTYYKRFTYSVTPEMDFLTVTRYIDGEPDKLYFSLRSPEPEEGQSATASVPAGTGDGGQAVSEGNTAEDKTTYNLLEIGDSGEGVKRLQERLIELGYLTGEADGKYGQMTSNAVSAAQAKMGMKATGSAGPQFQKALFAANAPAAK